MPAASLPARLALRRVPGRFSNLPRLRAGVRAAHLVGGDIPRAPRPGGDVVTATQPTPRGLDALAREITREHKACVNGLRTAVESAVRAGRLLQEAKRQVPHGGWLGWLEANFPASERTAQAYMRLAANPQLPADLTIDQALKQLAAPQVEPVLSERDARRLTDETGAALRELASRCRDGRGRGAHLALGYSTWEEYIALAPELQPPADIVRELPDDVVTALRRLMWEAMTSQEPTGHEQEPQ
jgi:Protein of unknown function (DUF3102)